MISTIHNDSMERVHVRQRGHRDQAHVMKPSCIVEYNKFMNGVDRIDQQIQYYPFVRKTIKWHKKFSMYLFQLCFHNAFILFRIQNADSKCSTLFNFISSVCRAWTKPQQHPAPTGPPSSSFSQRPGSGSGGSHKVVKIPATKKKPYPTRKCVVCIQGGQRKETRYMCGSCGAALHRECFNAYHSGE